MMDMIALQALAEGYARAPSPEGLDAAAQAALPLCAQVARRFIGRGAEYDDLYQAACLACVRALRVYQPERGVPLPPLPRSMPAERSAIICAIRLRRCTCPARCMSRVRS